MSWSRPPGLRPPGSYRVTSASSVLACGPCSPALTIICAQVTSACRMTAASSPLSTSCRPAPFIMAITPPGISATSGSPADPGHQAAGWRRDPDLHEGLHPARFRGSAGTSRRYHGHRGPAGLKQGITCQAGGRHRPRPASPAIFQEGSMPPRSQAVACHMPIRLEGRTRTLSGPSHRPDLFRVSSGQTRVMPLSAGDSCSWERAQSARLARRLLSGLLIARGGFGRGHFDPLAASSTLLALVRSRPVSPRPA